MSTTTTTTARTELDKLLEAMHDLDAETAATFLAEDVILRSPIVPQPFSGKETAATILGYILSTVDEFDSLEVLTGPENFAVFLHIRAGDTHVDGVDYVHFDEAGKVDAMTIQWRPLPSVVEMQNKLAPLLKMPALDLVPRAETD